MTDLYVPDLHLTEDQQNMLLGLEPSFSGTVIYGLVEELESKESRDLLENIISKGLKMNRHEVLVTAYSARKGCLRFQNILQNLSVSHVISFGVDPCELGLNINATVYNPLNTGRCEFLLSSGLNDILANQKHKMALWSALKSMYKM